MPFQVRNARLPYTSGGSGPAGSALIYALREMLYLAGYTEDSNDGDADWAGANLEINEPGSPTTGFTVDPSQARVITDQSASGRFTAGMAKNSLIALYATNDRNRILARIEEVVDANTIKIDPFCWNRHQPWIAETDMAGRVFNPLTTAPFGNGAWTLLDAPAGQGQVRLQYSSSSSLLAYFRPRGQLGDATETASRTIASFEPDTQSVLNMYVDDDNNVFLWWYSEDPVTAWGWIYTGLLDVYDPVNDPNPCFFSCEWAPGNRLHTYELDMVSHNNNAISGYPMEWWFGDNGDTAILQKMAYSSMVNFTGRALVDKPFCFMEDVADGGYIRGQLPIVRQCYSFEERRPIGRDWLVVRGEIAIPRGVGGPKGGLGDPYPMHGPYQEDEDL